MALHPLREAREKEGITQSQLGLKIGINSNYISDIEAWRRYPCKAWRDKLSAYFKIADFELFPKQEDLIEMIRTLTEENKKLQQLLTGNLSKESENAARDNTRFL